MLITKEKVLETFGKRTFEQKALMGKKIDQWDDIFRNKVQSTIKELIAEGFIRFDAGWYHLQPKGAEYIRNKTGLSGSPIMRKG